MLIVHALNALFYSLLLFLVSVGLSLILGLMGVVNLAHGAFYLLGAYVAFTVGLTTGSFILALLAGAAAAALAGFVLERVVIRHLHGEYLEQVLVTFGFVYIFMAVTKFFWGGFPKNLEKPALLAGSINLGVSYFPSYRLAMIIIGLIIALALWLLVEKTNFGVKLRAGVEDQRMAGALGININSIFIKVFILGSCLAGLAGGLGGPVIGAYPGLDHQMLMMALVIVIVGGFGSVQAAFFGSLFFGFIEVLSKVWFSEISMFVVFIAMAIVLVIKPQGILGKY